MNQNQKNIFLSIGVNKEDLKKLSKSELIKLFLQARQSWKTRSTKTNKKDEMMKEVLQKQKKMEKNCEKTYEMIYNIATSTDVLVYEK